MTKIDLVVYFVSSILALPIFFFGTCLKILLNLDANFVSQIMASDQYPYSLIQTYFLCASIYFALYYLYLVICLKKTLMRKTVFTVIDGITMMLFLTASFFPV